MRDDVELMCQFYRLRPDGPMPDPGQLCLLHLDGNGAHFQVHDDGTGLRKRADSLLFVVGYLVTIEDGFRRLHPAGWRVVAFGQRGAPDGIKRPEIHCSAAPLPLKAATHWAPLAEIHLELHLPRRDVKSKESGPI